MSRHAAACLAVSAIWTAGCAMAPEPGGVALQESPSARLARDASWTANGKFSVTHQGKQWLMRFDWEQTRETYRIDIHSPFGRVARLEGEPGRARLERKGRIRVAESADELAHALFGFPAPVSLLRHWLLGAPAPQPPIERHEFDKQGRAKSIEQSAWRVDYAAYYDDDAEQHGLPQRLRITGEDTSLLVYIASWTIRA